MPIPTPGTATFHTNIALPAGSDPQTRASFSTPLGELADRTAYLRARLSVDGTEFVYAATKTRKLVIDASEFLPSSGGTTPGVSDWNISFQSGVPHLNPLSNAAHVHIPVRLPSGCTVTGVEILTRASTARSGTNRWWLDVYKQSSPWSSPAAPTATQQGSTSYSGTASGHSLAVVSGLSALIAAEETVHVIVTGPTASLTADDRLLAVRVTFTDGGPRNA